MCCSVLKKWIFVILFTLCSYLFGNKQWKEMENCYSYISIFDIGYEYQNNHNLKIGLLSANLQAFTYNNNKVFIGLDGLNFIINTENLNISLLPVNLIYPIFVLEKKSDIAFDVIYDCFYLKFNPISLELEFKDYSLDYNPYFSFGNEFQYMFFVIGVSYDYYIFSENELKVSMLFRFGGPSNTFLATR